MLDQYANVLLFVLLGIGFGIVALAAAAFVRVKVKDPVKGTTYECGMEAIGTTEIQTNIRFYVYALLFVIFDVETLFVYPWAVNARQLGLFAFVEMLIFIGILFVGLIYAWRKGALQWE